MLQKFAPLIVLAMFGIGVYFMLQGMKGAIDMSDHRKVKKSEVAK